MARATTPERGGASPLGAGAGGSRHRQRRRHRRQLTNRSGLLSVSAAPRSSTLALGRGRSGSLVTDLYERRCAVTGERTLPVLHAAHIKPFGANGPHDPRNGLLLRSDLHTLFDRGYVTVTPQLRFEVSGRIRGERYRLSRSRGKPRLRWGWPMPASSIQAR